MSKECDWVRDRMYEYVKKQLKPAESSRISKHLKTCCKRFFKERYQQVVLELYFKEIGSWDMF